MADKDGRLYVGDKVYIVTDASLALMTPAVIKALPDNEGFVCVETPEGLKFLPAPDVFKPRPR
jgi:hypothetical protein